MAYSGRTLGRPTSSGSASLVDGVQIKIAEAYLPPPRVTLPVNFTLRNPAHILNQEYDFSLEERVLEWTANHRQALKDQKEAKEKEEQEASTESKQEPLTNGVSKPQENCPPNGMHTRPFLGTNLLVPTPIAASNAEKASTPVKGNAFNVADFERESDPFDNLELQTLNEMEELNKVLQETSALPESNTATSTVCSLKDVQYPDFDSLERSQQTNPYVNASSAGHPSGRLPPMPSHAMPYPQSNRSDVIVDVKKETVSYSNSPQTQTSSPVCSIRSAKSTPDISQTLNDKRSPSMKATSHTPPPYPCRVTPPPRPSSQQAWNPYSPLPDPPSSASSTPDPYPYLNADEQKLVDTLIVMGFDRGRTARTVKAVGLNDKKIVEFLCSMNRLSDSGLDGQSSEDGILLFDGNEEKAQQYWKLSKQFKELGFKHEDIKKALVSTQLDEEKTLDALTAT